MKTLSKSRAFAFVALLFGSSAVAGAGTQGNLSLSIDGHLRAIQERMALYHVNGCSIAMVKNFKIAWVKSFGNTGNTVKTPITNDTLFATGQMSEPVAHAVALKLIDENLVGLDTPISAVLKRYVAPQSGATIKNLLENKGGYSLPKYMGYDLGSIRPTLLEEIRQAPILTKPGTEWHRSPENTSVLQLALEDASGKPFQTLMMKVMGGGKSKYMEFPDDETYVDIAKGSTEDGTEVQHGGRVYPELAAAGLWTNANEYARFLANLMACAEGKQNAPWKQETAKIAFETIVKPRQQGPDFQAEAVSFGFATDQSRTYYFRGGSTLGYYCQSWMYPRTGSAIVVFTNRQLAWPFCNEIRDTFIGKLFEY